MTLTIGKEVEDEERRKQRWSTISDHQFFKRIPEWKRLSKEKNKYDMYEKGRTTKIITRLIFFLSLNCIFVMLGTFVFIAIEGSYQDRKAKEAYQIYLRKWKPRNISTSKLESIRDVAARQCEVETRKSKTKPWSYFHSIHLTYSTITTIGFGEQTAQTFWGRLATMIYAVFGIALFILFMASFRVLLLALINKVMSRLMHSRYREVRGRLRRIAKVALTVTIIIILWTVSSLFTLYQNEWSWFVSLYNIFIAVTTIGFGDMVVIDRSGGHEKDSEPHTPASCVEILLRLAFMINIILILTLFSTLFEQLKQNNVQTVSKRISHLVNSMNQANSEYIIIGPVFSRQAQDMITPCGKETLGVMQTIRESPAESVAERQAEFAAERQAEFAAERQAEFAAERQAEFAAERQAEFAAERQAESVETGQEEENGGLVSLRQENSRLQIYRDIANFRNGELYPDLHAEARSKVNQILNCDVR